MAPPVRDIAHEIRLANCATLVQNAHVLGWAGNAGSAGVPLLRQGYAMSDHNKQLVEHFINLYWNTGRFNLLRQIVTPDFVYHTTFAEGFKDVDSFVEYVKQIRTAIVDLDVSIEEIMAEGDRVITISTFSGSFQKPLFGFPPNNKVIGFSAVSTWEIRRGRVCSQNTLVDLAGLQRQMAQNWGNGTVRAAG